jgi:hypothetical protein
MTKEDKELLLKDLCARLSYSVKCYPVITNGEPNIIGGYCEVFDDFYIREVGGWFPISMIKPYLRPIHKLTKEELEELEFLTDSDYVDYCNKHHIDYRNLIPNGLALEAPEGMYN